MTNALPGLNATSALRAYQTVEGGIRETPGLDGAGATAGNGFADLVGRALQNAVTTNQSAESQALAAVSGHGDLTQVVTAVSRAELALQTTVAVRDRVIAAYQDIIKMQI